MTLSHDENLIWKYDRKPVFLKDVSVEVDEYHGRVSVRVVFGCHNGSEVACFYPIDSEHVHVTQDDIDNGIPF